MAYGPVPDSCFPPEPPHGPDTAAWIYYTNWRGRTRWRRIIPEVGGLRFRATEHHPQAQWLLDALDVTPESFGGPKGPRTFALAGISAWSAVEPRSRSARPSLPG
jgi:hypothetical protein